MAGSRTVGIGYFMSDGREARKARGKGKLLPSGV